jgi:predicted amidophosphoribosyltransferase
MIISCGLYYDVPGLRELCHAVKRRNKEAMYDAADSLSVLVKKYNLEGYSIIPIPNHSGRAEYTLEILNYLKQRCNIRVCDILLGSAHATQYDTKKAGSSLSINDLGFVLKNKTPSGRIVLFDNVIGTGTTYFSAMLTIGEDVPLLTLAQTYSTSYYKQQWDLFKQENQ